MDIGDMTDKQRDEWEQQEARRQEIAAEERAADSWTSMAEAVAGSSADRKENRQSLISKGILPPDD